MVNLQSADEVMRVIRNKKLLPSIINISSDKTPTQRAQPRSLIKKVEDHNLAHPNEQKKIKYINNVPSIVDKDFPSASSSKNSSA